MERNYVAKATPQAGNLAKRDSILFLTMESPDVLSVVEPDGSRLVCVTYINCISVRAMEVGAERQVEAEMYMRLLQKGETHGKIFIYFRVCNRRAS